MTFVCGLCQKSFTRKFNFQRHFNSVHDARFSGFECRKCGKKFTTRFYQMQHIRKCKFHRQSGGNILLDNNEHNHSNENENSEPPVVDGESTSLMQLIKTRWTSIRSYFKCHKVMDIFNFRVFQQKEELKDALTRVWLTKLNSQVKLQCSLGFILQHKTSHKLRYYHSSANNTALFKNAKHIKSLQDLLKIVAIIEQHDLLQFALAKRPDSSWTVIQITNLTFSLSKLQFPKFGAPTHLPKHISNNRSIMGLLSDGHKKFQDSLCFFRALALAISCECKHRCVCISKIEPTTQHLFKQFLLTTKQMHLSNSFKGVTMQDLPFLESLFKVKITVYSMKLNGSAQIEFQSFKSYPLELNLCAVKNHFCYIRDLANFTKCFQCKFCSKCFYLKSRLSKHSKGCSKSQSKLEYKGEYFFPPLSIFEEIEKVTCISTSAEKRFFPYFATFDIECFLGLSSEDNTDKMAFSSEHTLMSISVCSNIPGYSDPLCLVSEGSVDDLVEGFVLYLEKLSFVAKHLCFKRYADLFEGLQLFSKKRRFAEKKFESFSWSLPTTYQKRSIESLLTKLTEFCAELPVIGFNSQKYDINCMRTPLIRYLLKHDKIKFTIKRNNVMKCIKTDNLKFLDILNYIAPGFDYENFIKAYQCKMQKGFFPYEYVTSLEKLGDSALPPHSAFYSSLKQKNISTDDYAQCQKIWCKHEMKTLRDYLVYYNNLDVVPFLEAISKQHAIYSSKGIDMFKDGVSVPSLATKWLYLASETNHFSIPLISKKNADLHTTIRQNIVGGPAIVFHRYHEKNKTFLRQHEFGSKAKLCKTIYGFDANALYLYCAMQKLPTGPIIRRKREDNFRPTFSDYFGQLSLEWLEFEAMQRNIFIQHKFNKGEQRLGQQNLPVDGISKSLHTVFQFHGCLFHGCQLKSCSVTKGMTVNPINNKPFSQLHFDTKLKEAYIKHLGYDLEIMYECQWIELKKSSVKCKEFVNKLMYRSFSERKPMTHEQIINSVKADQLFGFVECDIHVPKSLEFQFSEMPPIFKHASLSRDDLSHEMREYSLTHDILSQPQKSLIGSFFGKKVLVLTSLLKWYLEHGLIVSTIYQVVQFHGYNCFNSFAESVCDTRRQADCDDSKKIIAETAKLCGNVIYGATITDKERFTNVKYVTDISSASKLVNSKHFIDMDELADDVFEIQLSKQRIKLDTPIVIGFSILQLAKLRMLQFYYDVMSKYVCRKDFQYVTMDTDSAYFATSGNFEDIVIPSMRQEFFNEYEKWFVPPFCDSHKADFVQCKLSGKQWKINKCCELAFNFHKRTPGLFKEEYKGNGIVALNSKTYFCFGDNGQKMSTKGISKKQNNLQKHDFLKVLKRKQIVCGTNRGIVRKKHKMLSYSQVKKGLNYFYAKRRVLSDGVSTYPLYK